MANPTMQKGERRDFTSVALLNDDIGLEFSWETSTMPYLIQWKNTRQGIYVSGIEPSNCIPEGQNVAREVGRLMMLEQQETQRFELFIEVLDGQDKVAQMRTKIENLKQYGTPVKIVI